MPSAMTRREWLAAASAVLGSALPAIAEGRPGAVLDHGGMAAVVETSTQPIRVYDKGRWCEGPVWSDRLGGLVFSDVKANCIRRLGAGGTATTVRDPSRYANGNAVDAEGRLITCEHLGRRVVRQENDGTLTVLADSYDGKPLNSPNDVVVAQDGAVWFTDPTFGLTMPEEGRSAAPEQRGRFVFRLDLGRRLEVAADSFEQPNGLAFSPDGSRLYVSDTSAALNPEGRREIRAFDVGTGGRLRNERSVATLSSGIPDGLACDADGRLYAATGDGARVWSADGTPVGLIATPGPCGNLAFGGPEGRRLFLCAGTDIYAIDLKVRGADLFN